MNFFLTVRSIVIQNNGSGFRRPINYGSGTVVLIVDFFNVISQKAVQKVYRKMFYSSNKNFAVKKYTFLKVFCHKSKHSLSDDKIY
jgi:hypothetical protein